MIKRVYTDLAPRLFEQLEPPKIQALSETIVDECKKTGVDPLFVLAIIEVESNFDVEAVSSAGARGLMQIMPATFKGVSKSKRMLDPIENVKAGITYISLLYSQGFKTPEKLLHAYNQGPGNALAVFRGEMDIPTETRVHIPKVMQTYYRLLAQDGLSKKEAGKRFLVAQK
jgi:soluble lytic murein transglycosylase-like protein